MDESAPPAPGYRALREISHQERPRERLLRHGGEVLGDPELVAILLGSGLPGENVIDMARRILAAVGGLGGLVRADAAQLQKVRGLGEAKAAQLLAAIELGRRMNLIAPDARPMLLSPEAVYSHFAGRYIGKTKEELFALALDTRGRLLGAPSFVPGTVDSVPVRVADVFREAIIQQAVSLVLVHNHPSGDATPSPQDLVITRQLAASGELLDIELLDHIIIGQGKWVSMARDGYGFRTPAAGLRKAGGAQPGP